jgi:pyrimidine deaminase RibD-like protein
MKMAIAAERKSRSEDDVPRPQVGAVLVKDGKIEVASRGEIDEGEHAEYTLMERKLIHRSIRGSTLYTTLEPCSSRNHPKSPCAERIVTRGIAKVFIGMLDPNPDVYGKGFLRMQKSGIKVEMFPEPSESYRKGQRAIHCLPGKPF